jgi:hypothetical protein
MTRPGLSSGLPVSGILRFAWDPARETQGGFVRAARQFGRVPLFDRGVFF